MLQKISLLRTTAVVSGSHTVVGQSQWIAVGRDNANTHSVMTSPDGITWTLEPTGPSELMSDVGAIGYNGKEWLAAASFGGEVAPTAIFLSTDGKTWTAGATTPDGVLASEWITHPLTWFAAAGIWVFAGYNEATIISTDGLEWTPINGTAMFGDAVAASDSRMVTVGGFLEGPTSGYALATDATTLVFDFTLDPGGGGLDVVWSPVAAIWVATTESFGVVYTSPDGATWTEQTTPAVGDGQSNALAYGDGVFVASFGSFDFGTVCTSADGITWTERSITFADGDAPLRVDYGGGTFIITTGLGNIFYSKNAGVTWSGPIATPFTYNAALVPEFDPGGQINAMAYGGGLPIRAQAVATTPFTNVNVPDELINTLPGSVTTNPRTLG